MPDLTQTDRNLLAALKRDGRAAVTALASDLKVSRATVQASMEKLIRTGAIRRFTIEMDTSVAGEMINAVMTIELQGNLAREVIKHLRNIPEIISLHSTNGSWDLVAHVETSSLLEFDKVLGQVREISGVLNSETSILLNKT